MTATPKAPNLRTLAQEDSEWQITQDIPIYGVKAGVSYPKGVADWDVLDTISAGEKVRVVSPKITPWGRQKGQTLSYEGLWLRLERLQDGKEWTIQFSDFNKSPVMLSAPEPVPMYVMRDTATGKWYSGNEVKWNGGLGYDATALFEDKLTKARKFKRLADVRAHMLIIGGYYEGLPDTGNLPDWMRFDGKIEWPSTMEIVEIDKITKKEMRTFETAAHQTKMWRLRDLTLKFGSSVRAMYKKLEDKNQLGEYPSMVVWRVKGDAYWDYEMDAGEVDAIKTVAKTIGKDKCIVVKNQTNVCLACVNEGVAWAATTFYTGALSPHVVSLANLLECVPTETAVEQTRKVQAPEGLDLPDLDLGM